MSKAQSYYQKQLEFAEAEWKRYKSRSLLISALRLSTFVVTGFAVYLLWGNDQGVMGAILVGVVAFLVLVRLSGRMDEKKRFFKRKTELNREELKALSGDFSSFKDGMEYASPTHEYAQDIDLFGPGSFFQYLNRTGIEQGRALLAGWLTSNKTDGIEAKQAGIKELATQTEWRQDYQVYATLVHAEMNSASIVRFLKEYQSFVNPASRVLTWIFSLASSTVIALAILAVIPGAWVFYWILVGLGITGLYFKKISQLQGVTTQIKSTFLQYAQLIKQIEQGDFKAEWLTEQKNRIREENKAASSILNQFSKLLDQLDQRSNLLVAFIGNGLFLWDVIQASHIEKWIKNHNNKVEEWFEAIAFFDAANSLANLVYNHPEYQFPTIQRDDKTLIQATQLAHPLIKKEVRIANDIELNRKNFFIITGANMAGKSTFLRTVSLSMVMANAGLPVCAEHYVYSPIKLITSMRTSDSLQKDESYFFSELKRLKFIVDHLEKDEYFIILDEILKGTNSEDKKNGSKKFVERLIKLHSTGIIATHDLSLCELGDSLPEVQNHYFDAEIINDELHFDYKFKSGVCQNMNASFLLRKMEIV